MWGPLGVESLRRFRDSYLRHPGGCEHRLLVLYNGIAHERDLDAYESELVDLPHELLRTPSPMQDLDAYRYAAEHTTAASYCFLNSYSVLLADGWLASLTAALEQPGAGIAGASGSWASMRSLARYDLLLGGPYSRVFDDRSQVRSQLAKLAATRARSPAPNTRERWPLAKLRVAFRVLEQTRGFLAFPAAHVRTNGFLLARDTLLALSWPRLRRKAQAHRLESGVGGITEQIRRAGLEALVVARDGSAYTSRQWHLSRTFWQGDQENLLVADNQTTDYANGDRDMRAFLARYAWGLHADPSGAVKVAL